MVCRNAGWPLGSPYPITSSRARRQCFAAMPAHCPIGNSSRAGNAVTKAPGVCGSRWRVPKRSTAEAIVRDRTGACGTSGPLALGRATRPVRRERDAHECSGTHPRIDQTFGGQALEGIDDGGPGNPKVASKGPCRRQSFAGS